MFKRKVIQLIVFLVTLLHFNSAMADDLKLQQLNIFFRHGDRMPIQRPEIFPNDPNMKSEFYPMGSGGLTNEGKMREYRFGKFLRNAYSEFLGPEYETNRLYAVSSNSPRTKMSLQLVLAGLYPPALSKKSNWNNRLNWQPIPFQFFDSRKDNYFTRAECKSYQEEYEKVQNFPEIKKELNKFEEYLEELRIATGSKSNLTLPLACVLYSNLQVEKKLNLILEPWMIKTLQDKRLEDLVRLEIEIDNYSPKMRRLLIGYLLRQINEDMTKASNHLPGYDKKISLYSGHDLNIISLLLSLNVWDLSLPEFGAAVIFELWMKNDKYFVKIVHYLGIPEETKNIVIPGCDEFCPLEMFLALTKDAEIRDEEIECIK